VGVCLLRNNASGSATACLFLSGSAHCFWIVRLKKKLIIAFCSLLIVSEWVCLRNVAEVIEEAMPRNVRRTHVVGPPQDLVLNQLPTHLDVVKFYNYVQLQMRAELRGQEPTSLALTTEVAAKIEEIWMKASIPFVSRTRIRQMIYKDHQREQVLTSRLKRDKGKASFVKTVNVFKKSLQRLFDIAACKCETASKCRCPVNQRVPELERPFLEDQRSKRVMVIDGVDIPVTKIIQTKILKKTKREEDALR